MSEQRVNKIASFNGTAPTTGITPSLGDSSTQVATTEFVRGEIDSEYAKDLTFSGDVTFTGDVDFSDANVTLPEDTTFGAPIFPVAMGVYNTAGKPVGSISLIYQAGITMSADKNETGSTTINLSEPMSGSSTFTVLPVAAWLAEVQQLSVSIQYHTAASFTIVVEADNGVNVDTEVRFMIFGQKA